MLWCAVCVPPCGRAGAARWPRRVAAFLDARRGKVPWAKLLHHRQWLHGRASGPAGLPARYLGMHACIHINAHTKPIKTALVGGGFWQGAVAAAAWPGVPLSWCVPGDAGSREGRAEQLTSSYANNQAHLQVIQVCMQGLSCQQLSVKPAMPAHSASARSLAGAGTVGVFPLMSYRRLQGGYASYKVRRPQASQAGA